MLGLAAAEIRGCGRVGGAGIRGGVQGGRGVYREPLQQRAEGLPVPSLSNPASTWYSAARSCSPSWSRRARPRGGGYDPPGPPVGRVRPPLDQAVRTGTRCSYSPPNGPS